MINPMEAFVGTGFDVEFFQDGDTQHFISTLIHFETKNKYRPYTSNCAGEWQKCRPRLNKPQVIGDWSWVPDGFVWRARWLGFGELNTTIMDSKKLRDLADCDLGEVVFDSFMGEEVVFASCIGVEKGSDLEEWAKANDVPIIDIGEL